MELKDGMTVLMKGGFGTEAEQTAVVRNVSEHKGQVAFDYTDKNGNMRWAYASQVLEIKADQPGETGEGTPTGETITIKVSPEMRQVLMAIVGHSRTQAIETSGIKIAGHIGRWSIIDETIRMGRKLYLLEHDAFGDQAACIITDEFFHPIRSDVWNGFDDLDEWGLALC